MCFFSNPRDVSHNSCCVFYLWVYVYVCVLVYALTHVGMHTDPVSCLRNMSGQTLGASVTVPSPFTRVPLTSLC
jgi:hypothetical protein